MQTEREYTIEELADLTDTPVRTIRFYISEGLLPGSQGRGKAAGYGEEHLLRLRLIRALTEQRLPLAEVRALMAPMTLDEVRLALADAERRRSLLDGAVREQSPRDYVAHLLSRARGRQPSEPVSRPPALRQVPPTPPSADTWRRIELADGVELHVRADADAHLVERLLKAAREAVRRR